jgi:hypothetical protein
MAGTGFLSGNIFGIALRQTTATQETLTTAGLPRSFQIQHFIVGAFAIAAGTTIQIWRVRGGVATDLTPGGGALALGGAAYLNNAIGAVVIPVANNTANATFLAGDQLRMQIAGANATVILIPICTNEAPQIVTVT